MSGYNSDELDRLEPSYLSSYGLQEAPFAPNHHDKFMFLDGERAQRLNMLQHMVRYSNLLLIVQGEQGVGKTSLMHRFIHNAEPNWQICEVTANTMIDADQLLFQAAQGFGVSELPQDSSELQEMLYDRVATFHHNEQTPILIIDDAHLLPKDALLAIFNLADAYVNDVNLLRIILFAEPQIDKIINSKDVKVLCERVTHSMEIPPFDEEGTAEYLKHRLAVAGFNGGSPFTPKIIKKIHRSSGGVPEKVNELAHESLAEGDLNTEEESVEMAPDQFTEKFSAIESAEGQVSEVQQRKQAKPIIYASAAVLLVVIVLVFQDSINSLFEEEESAVDFAQNEVEQPAINPAENPLVNNDRQTGEQLSKEIDLKEKIIPLSEQAETQVDQKDTSSEEQASPTETQTAEGPVAEQQADAGPATEPVTQLAEVKEDPKPAPEVHSVEPSPVPVNSQQQTIKIIGQGFSPRSEIMLSWTGKEKKLAASQFRVVNENEIEMAITVGMTEDEWAIKVVNADSDTKNESNKYSFKVVDTQVDEGYRKDKWLLAQEPTNFTLQLFGTNKKSNADQFIEQHKLKEKAGYFYTQRKGGDWFSVVYGNYSTQSSAKTAAGHLPGSLSKIKPWVRRMDDIQASINASRKLVQKKTTTTSKLAVTSTATKPTSSGTEVKTSSNDSVNSQAQNESWLWSQDPRNFTLQLLGARKSSSIEKFVKKYSSLNGKTVYFHTRHDTRDWYTVVYGVYPDRQTASKAIKRLPSELQSSSPWIRSFGSIHAELDRAE